MSLIGVPTNHCRKPDENPDENHRRKPVENPVENHRWIYWKNELRWSCSMPVKGKLSHNDSVVPNDSTDEHPWERMGRVVERREIWERNCGTREKSKVWGKEKWLWLCLWVLGMFYMFFMFKIWVRVFWSVWGFVFYIFCVRVTESREVGYDTVTVKITGG